MDANAESRAKLEAARQEAVAAQAANSGSNQLYDQVDEVFTQPLATPSQAAEPHIAQASSESEKARPIRSAKDAINAMYAQDANNRLSNYLAASAKEIINSSSSNGDNKTAASLHKHATKRRIEMARPSASGLFRVAATDNPIIPSDTSHAMDPLARKTNPSAKPRIIKPREEPSAPVIKTSLKLGPKKTPAILNAEVKARTSRRKSLNGQKKQTALAELLASHPANPRKINDISGKAHPKTVDAQTAETLRIMRQSVQKATGVPIEESPQLAHPKKRTSRGMMQDIIRPSKSQNTSQTMSASSSNIPADSVKHRFKAAPKGYTAQPETINTGYVGFDEPIISQKPPVEIYGLMDEEPTGKSPEKPIIEDYHPKDNPKTTSTDKAPDGNKYSVQGQSPFFLKSVSVEKRPLSGSIGNSKTSASEGTLYERPANTPVGGKNVYDRKEAKKTLPTKPTVIIPASRRSKAPLIFLMILTVVLGAAVGAFVYLCFFQYME